MPTPRDGAPFPNVMVAARHINTLGIIMKPVIQLERTGCGIASVSAVVGLSYQKVKSIANSMGIFTHDESLWSETAHVRKLLNHFGITTGFREIPFRSWESLPDLALLAIKWHLENGRSYWHWVVFVRVNGISYVLDSKKSLRTNRRTDFGRMKPKWYIPVTDVQQRLPRGRAEAARR